MARAYALTDSVTRYTIENGDILVFDGYCLSGLHFTIQVKLSDANRWINGEYIQECFPYLSKEDREILISGLDAESWADMLNDEN